MSRLAVAATALAVAGCGSPDPRAVDAAGGPADAPRAAVDGPGEPIDAAAVVDAAAAPDAVSPDGWRSSLAACWTDAACPRVMAIGHGGAWDAVAMPYDSNAAIANAFAIGMDGVKLDVRVTVDDVPVIAHSSPIQWYESLDCSGQTIEAMTAAQVTACHRLPSSTETFQRLDDVLDYLRGKMVVQLTVKRTADYARAIAQVHASGAEDFAFLEVDPGDLTAILPGIAGADTVWYLVNLGSSLAAIDTTLALGNPRAFMYELDPTVPLGTVVADTLHPAGIRAFTYDSSATATTDELKALFDQGYDVVSSQQGAADVGARQQVNAARGVTPP